MPASYIAMSHAQAKSQVSEVSWNLVLGYLRLGGNEQADTTDVLVFVAASTDRVSDSLTRSVEAELLADDETGTVGAQRVLNTI